MDSESGEYLSHLQSPTEKMAESENRLAVSNLKQQLISEAIVIAKEPTDVSLQEINKVVEFIKPIKEEDLKGTCTERTAETVFAGLAEYGWERKDSHENSGIIPHGLHMISGKKLADGSVFAFDTVSRGIILQDTDHFPDDKPIAQTIIFKSDSENEMQKILHAFYGGNFEKQTIEDTPAERFNSTRR